MFFFTCLHSENKNFLEKINNLQKYGKVKLKWELDSVQIDFLESVELDKNLDKIINFMFLICHKKKKFFYRIKTNLYQIINSDLKVLKLFLKKKFYLEGKFVPVESYFSQKRGIKITKILKSKHSLALELNKILDQNIQLQYVKMKRKKSSFLFAFFELFNCLLEEFEEIVNQLEIKTLNNYDKNEKEIENIRTFIRELIHKELFDISLNFLLTRKIFSQLKKRNNNINEKYIFSTDLFSILKEKYLSNLLIDLAHQNTQNNQLQVEIYKIKTQDNLEYQIEIPNLENNNNNYDKLNSRILNFIIISLFGKNQTILIGDVTTKINENIPRESNLFLIIGLKKLCQITNKDYHSFLIESIIKKIVSKKENLSSIVYQKPFSVLE